MSRVTAIGVLFFALALVGCGDLAFDGELGLGTFGTEGICHDPACEDLRSHVPGGTYSLAFRADEPCTQEDISATCGPGCSIVETGQGITLTSRCAVTVRYRVDAAGSFTVAVLERDAALDRDVVLDRITFAAREPTHVSMAAFPLPLPLDPHARVDQTHVRVPLGETFTLQAIPWAERRMLRVDPTLASWRLAGDAIVELDLPIDAGSVALITGRATQLGETTVVVDVRGVLTSLTIEVVEPAQLAGTAWCAGDRC